MAGITKESGDRKQGEKRGGEGREGQTRMLLSDGLDQLCPQTRPSSQIDVTLLRRAANVNEAVDATPCATHSAIGDISF